jgi:hypothetical protein
MKRMKYYIILIGLTISSCSPGVFNEYQSPNYLQPDTIEVKNFISKIEDRFSNYADTSSKSLPIFKTQADSTKQPKGPNPFSPTTTIEFFLQKPDTVNLVLYAFDGLDSCVVYYGYVPKGRSWMNFVRSNMPSGIYYLMKQFKSGGKEISRYKLLK